MPTCDAISSNITLDDVKPATSELLIALAQSACASVRRERAADWGASWRTPPPAAQQPDRRRDHFDLSNSDYRPGGRTSPLRGRGAWDAVELTERV